MCFGIGNTVRGQLSSLFIYVSVFPRLCGRSTRGKTWTLESDSMVTWIGLIRICYGQPYCSDSGLGWAMAMEVNRWKIWGMKFMKHSHTVLSLSNHKFTCVLNFSKSMWFVFVHAKLLLRVLDKGFKNLWWWFGSTDHLFFFFHFFFVWVWLSKHFNWIWSCFTLHDILNLSCS